MLNTEIENMESISTLQTFDRLKRNHSPNAFHPIDFDNRRPHALLQLPF